MNKLLKAENIHKSYLTPIPLPGPEGINLELEPGEMVAIMGASGEGKSTLLHILGTLEAPCSGTLTIDGVEIKGSASKIRNQKIGFIFQAFHLLEDYTVLENVLMPAKIAREEEMRKKRAVHLLEKVGLLSKMHTGAKLLSGGEKQRVAIARALCNDPPLILADEPSGNLDHATSQIIHLLLLNAAREFDKTIVIVTHDEELAGLCDRKLLLKDGILSCIY